MKTENVCNEFLLERIAQSRHLLGCAAVCLKDGDFLQCAVRLEEIKDICNFDKFTMGIFDAEGEKSIGG